MRFRTTANALAVLALTMLAGAAPASAQSTPDVCPTGCPHSTIQAAVNAWVDPNNPIDVGNGTYNERVTIPASRPNLILRGARAGNPANMTAQPAGVPESVIVGGTAGATDAALRVLAERVTIDGFTIRDSSLGVWASASGLRVVNSVFRRNGNAVVPDGNGAYRSVIRHNGFLSSGAVGGFAPGAAILSGSTAGNLVVEENLIAEHHTGTLVHLYAARSSDVIVQRNVGAGNVGSIAILRNVEDLLVADNEITDATGVVLDNTTDAVVRGNSFTGRRRFGSAILLTRETGPNAGTVIEANDVSGASPFGAIFVRDGAAVGTVEAHFNRLPGQGQVGIETLGDADIDATDNWWGCNEGPGQFGCSLTEVDFRTRIMREPHLVLTVRTDRTRLEQPGDATTITATLLRNSNGDAFGPRDFPAAPLRFSTSSGQLNAGALVRGTARAVLAADTSAGADVTATLDGTDLATHVDFGPAPALTSVAGPAGPAGPAGTAGPQGPRGEAGAQSRTGAASETGVTGQAPATARTAPNSCRRSGRLLDCVLGSRLAQTRGVRAALLRGGRRVAAARPAVVRTTAAGSSVRLTLPAMTRFAPGRYTLVVTRGGRTLRRQAVQVIA